MRRLVPFAVLVGAVALLDGRLDQRFHVRVLTLAIVWALAGVAWNLMAKAGQISLGHSAFTGIGAYAFTMLLRSDADVSPWIGMAVGMGIAAFLALAVGLPTFRLKGFYFTLATISFPLILELLVAHNGDPELTVPFHPENEWRYMEFADAHTYVWIGLVMLVVALAISALIDVTSFGFALRAIRDNEVLARAVGIRTVAWKSAAFIISAALSAAMAVLWVKAVLRVTVAEEVFGITVVIVMLSVAFVGGVGRTWGPVVGAAFLIPLAMFLDDTIGESVPGAQELVYAAALVLVALLIPEGIVPAVERGWERLAGVLFGSSPSRRPRPGPAGTRPAADTAPAGCEAASPAAHPVAAGDAGAGGGGSGEELRRQSSAVRRDLPCAGGRAAGAHRTQRRGKDDAVQHHDRPPAGRRRPGAVQGSRHRRDAGPPALRAGDFAHVPGAPGVPSHVAAGQCGGGRHRRVGARIP